MAVIEVQVTLPSFLAMQLNKVMAVKFCAPSAQTIGPFRILVDHVEFGANAMRHSVAVQKTVYYRNHGVDMGDAANGFEVQLAQPITAVLTDLGDVLASPNAAATPILSISATAVFRLDYFVAGDGQCFMVVEFDALERTPLPPLPAGLDEKTLWKKVENLARTAVPQLIRPFNPASILLGSPNVENAGMSVDSGGTRLALRQELGGSGPWAAIVWSQFFKGNVPDRLQGADWCTFIAEGTLRNFFALKVGEGLNGATVGGRLHIVTGIGAAYSNSGGIAHLTVTFGGSLDVELCSVWIDVRIECDISVGTANELVFDAELFFTPATNVCTIPLLLVSEITGASIESVVLAAVSFFQTIGAFFGLTAGSDTMGSMGFGDKLAEMDCQTLSPTHHICRLVLGAPKDTPFGTLSFDGVAALNDGISLLGRLHPTTLTGARIEPEIYSNFVLLPPDVSCGEISGQEGALFTANPAAYVTARANVHIGNSGTAPLYFCGVEVVDDPLNVFPKSNVVIEGDQAPIDITVTIPFPPADYFKAPYPCNLLVKTSGGIRLVSIPAVPALTKEEIDRLAVELAEQLGWCQKLLDDWFNYFRRYNPRWSVDPSPEGRVVEHLWAVDVSGLPAGDHVTLVDESGATLVTAVAREGRSTYVTSLRRPVGDGELGIQRGSSTHAPAPLAVRSTPAPAPAPAPLAVRSAPAPAPGDECEPCAGRGIGIVQRTIVRLASVPLYDPCLRLAAAYLDGAPCVIAVTPGRCLAYDVSTPRLPRLVRSIRVDGLRGAIPWRDGLLGFGEDGLTPLTPDGTVRDNACCRDVRPVFDAVCGQNVIYAVTAEGLEVHSNRLLRMSSKRCPGARRLVRFGHVLVVAGRRSLSRYDVTDAWRPVSRGRYFSDEIDELVIPPGAHGHTVVATTSSGSARAVEFPNDGEPEIAATYDQVPWFVGAVWLPGILAKLSEDRTLVHVSRLGRSATL